MNPPNEPCHGFLCTGHFSFKSFPLYVPSEDYTAWPPFISPSYNSSKKTSYKYTGTSTKVTWNSNGTITYTDPDGTVRTINRWDDGDNGN